ncbi:hypothetical protein DRQ32_05070 [bacterium]|nr:MAG: hypothetical protein DRQ32_05070 [bacterium]
MEKAEAEHLISLAASRRIDLGFTKHFWEEAAKCAPVLSKNHVYTALRNGNVYGTPVRDDGYVCHKVKVRATLPDLGRMEIVVAITLVDTVVCITIYDIE